MRTVMSAQQMREVDKYMIETLEIPSIVLMENAAMGTARLIMEKKPEPCVVHVFCGTGNNGGDGLACARVLLARGYDAYVVIVGDDSAMSEDARRNYAFFQHFSDRVLHVTSIEDLYGWRVPKADVIVDAIFGIGLTREVLGVHADVIASINSAQALRVSVDIPSGIDADTGRILGVAVHADCTATFQYPKIGHYLYPGREYTGELRVVPIGIDKGVEETVNSRMVVYESNDPDVFIPVRNPDTNKGSYGKLLLLAGSRGMAGAAVLSARAAYAAGAGLVTVAAPWAVIDVMQNAVPEATCELLPEQEGQLYSGSTQAIEKAARNRTAITIGPGLGSGNGLKAMVSEILTTVDMCRVVDADALNALDKDLKILAHIRGDVVFTPHPLEFARLLGTELHSVLEHPLELATAFAQKCRVTLVLKGATTIVAGPNGDISFIAAGSPGMAKGGSGDVLAGVIGGIAAQGVEGMEAAVLGAYLCAMAGEQASAEMGEYSATPQDTIRHLGDVIEECLTPDMPVWQVTRHRNVEISDERGKARARKKTHVPSDVVRTSAQRTVQQPPAEDEALPAPAVLPLEGTESVDPLHAEIEEHPAAQSEAEGSSVRKALNAASRKAAVSIHSETTAADDEGTSSASHEQASPVSAGTSAGEAGEAKRETRRPGSRGTRMSASDIRPPRIAPQASRETQPAQRETLGVKGASVDEPTKVVESLEETLAANKEGPSAESAVRAQTRSDRRAADKSRARRLEAADAGETEANSEDDAAEERKRARLNQEIQQELSKNKGQGRTRRRIG